MLWGGLAGLAAKARFDHAEMYASIWKRSVAWLRGRSRIFRERFALPIQDSREGLDLVSKDIAAAKESKQGKFLLFLQHD